MRDHQPIVSFDDADPSRSWRFALDNFDCCFERLGCRRFQSMVTCGDIGHDTMVSHPEYTCGKWRRASEVPPVCNAMAFCVIYNSGVVARSVLGGRNNATSSSVGSTAIPKFAIGVAFVAAWLCMYFTIGEGSSKSKTNSGFTVPNSRYADPRYRPQVSDSYVQPYLKSDGTRVRGHLRTDADDSFWNNYSSKGNVNPHTGEVGTKRP